MYERVVLNILDFWLVNIFTFYSCIYEILILHLYFDPQLVKKSMEGRRSRQDRGRGPRQPLNEGGYREPVAK